MVNFSVFNELSLPFSTDVNVVRKFTDFFQLLEALKEKGLNALRVSEDFKNSEILRGVNLQKFTGQQRDREFQRKILSFLNSGIVLIDSPIIKEEESEELDAARGLEYLYNGRTTDGGLACCDIWDTIAVSFNSDAQWDSDNIALKRKRFSGDGDIVQEDISIRHSSKMPHLKAFHDFFDALEKEIKLAITQENVWRQKQEFFPNVVIFCPEVELQISKLDKYVFQQAISILRDVETRRKLITDFRHSGESETVRDNPKLRQTREFTVDGEKIFFEKHIKSFPHNYRMYFMERNNKIYIGYIGKHLRGKKE